MTRRLFLSLIIPPLGTGPGASTLTHDEPRVLDHMAELDVRGRSGSKCTRARNSVDSNTSGTTGESCIVNFNDLTVRHDVNNIPSGLVEALENDNANNTRSPGPRNDATIRVKTDSNGCSVSSCPVSSETCAKATRLGVILVIPSHPGLPFRLSN